MLTFFVLAIASTWLLNTIIHDTTIVVFVGTISGIVINFFSGFVAGYAAKKHHVLHGCIAGLLFVLVPTAIFMGIWLYWGIVLKAIWTGGSLSDMTNFIILGIGAMVFSCIISMLGAKLSEVMQKKPKEKLKLQT